MTEVCLVAAEDATLPADLLSYPTAREALATYDLHRPYADTVAVETVSVGAAVSLLNDLDWYLTRLTSDALVRDPSVDEAEWLSRRLAREVREGHVDPAATGEHLKVYGVTEDDRLVDPMFVQRVEGSAPEYDLRDVEETVVVRVTPGEFD
ncbi:MAG: DUF5804 family protein [Halobacteriaceae archaeon]